ncbi:hypothetical protein M8C13_35455 [Crossiella sp. SN42]|uniref:hypothetical protein n=1 Tax=Crossiella sp. SN42 TaxID=2944808 RepID=UPI00207C8BB7|nr:hypothetical protein [Crossiella sp. SN42]MCO1581063.1 hypothetical protein [Crossiella sp. SN42]
MPTTPLPVPCTRAQAVAALGEPGLGAALRAGRLRRIWHDLFVPADRARDRRTRARAALLLAGAPAALTGPTAAEIYGWLPPHTLSVHVAVPPRHRARGRPGLILHPAEFTEEDVLRLDDLPVLTSAHVLATLLATHHPNALPCVRTALRDLPPDLRRTLVREIRSVLRRSSERPPGIAIPAQRDRTSAPVPSRPEGASDGRGLPISGERAGPEGTRVGDQSGVRRIEVVEPRYAVRRRRTGAGTG